MRGIKVVAVAGLIAGLGLAQPPMPPPPSLEEVLAIAFKNNPDVQVAEAKLQEAAAEVRRVRLGIVQRVLDAQRKVEAMRRMVQAVQEEFMAVDKQRKAGTIPESELHKALSVLVNAKSDLAQAERNFDAAIGKVPEGVLGAIHAELGKGGPGVVPPDNFAVRAPHGPMADKMRKALDTPVKVATAPATSLADFVDALREKAGGVPIQVDLRLGDKAKEPIKLSLSGEVPFGSLVQALQDSVPGLQCYVRDYGILITTVDFPPEDGLTVLDFWHGTKPQPRPGGM